MNSNQKLIEHFINELDTELSIRKKELNSIREVIDSQANMYNKFILIRNTIPTLYAHYEGFLKFSFLNLLDTIKKMNLNSASGFLKK